MSSFTENLYLKRAIQQLQEENLKLRAMLSEQFEFVREVTGPNSAGRQSLFRHADTGHHIVVSHGDDPSEGGRGKLTQVFASDEHGNADYRNDLWTGSGHQNHGRVAAEFGKEEGSTSRLADQLAKDSPDETVDMPTNPFPVSVREKTPLNVRRGGSNIPYMSQQPGYKSLFRLKKH